MSNRARRPVQADAASSTEMLDAALEYARRQVRVFPIHSVTDSGCCGCGSAECNKVGKHPVAQLVPDGFKSATTDEETIRGWWGFYPEANIGRPTDSVFVLDVDRKKGGDDTLHGLERRYGQLPRTPLVLTGGGGAHYYFAMPTPAIGNSVEKLGSGVDTRGVGGYVLLPPSRHKSGRRYVDDADRALFETPLAPVPSWMLAMLAQAGPSPNGGPTPEATDWAELLSGAPEGQRHDIALRLAGHYLGLRIPRAEVEKIVLGYAERCVPPFPADEAKRIILDLAAKDQTKDAARGAPAGDGVGGPPDFTIHDAGDVWRFDPPEFVVDELLPQHGVVWIGGLPKRFKSLLLLYLCLANASDRKEVAEHFPIRRRPKILYLSKEDPGYRLEVRRKDILGAWGGALPRPGRLHFLIRQHFTLLDAGHIGWLRDYCRRLDITVVILDTWTRLSLGADPMSAKDQAGLASVVTQLAEDIHGAIVGVDHTRKNRPDGQWLSSADVFGPVQKWSVAEHLVLLAETADRSRLECFLEGKDTETRRFFLTVSPLGSGTEKFKYAGSVERIADDQRARGADHREAVRFATAAEGTPVGIDKILATLAARNLPLGRRTVQRHLNALVRTRLLAKTGSGSSTCYTLSLADRATQPSDAREHGASTGRENHA